MNRSVSEELNYGNKSKVPIKGKGNINIQLKDGTNVTLADVHYVLDLFWNLLSMAQLTEKGNKIYIQNCICEIKEKITKLLQELK